MGLTGEGYRTGGVALIKSALIRQQPGTEVPPEAEIAAAQIDIEMHSGKLPLFNVAYTGKGQKPFLLLDQVTQFHAAVKLGHIFVNCKVEGTPDADLQMMERISMEGEDAT